MTRFFAEPSSISGGTVRLSPDDHAHIRAARLRPDELFVVCDGAGTDYICRIGQTAGVLAEIVEARASSGEPRAGIYVYIALMKGDRLDFAVQKSVELGAGAIVLFSSERCVSVPGDRAKKLARLQKIALEAAKQSGRGRVPRVTAAESFKAACDSAAHASLSLFCYEDEKKRGLKDALTSCALSDSVAVMTGPEGGFTPLEAETAQNAGMLAVSLGARLLRCETAPMAALAALLYHMGEM
jgi:16S rRNA (uracil1498-N3)-methyltransferase